jgi:hypothetical protein
MLILLISVIILLCTILSYLIHIIKKSCSCLVCTCQTDLRFFKPLNFDCKSQILLLTAVAGPEVPKRRPGRKRGRKLYETSEPYIKTEVMETFRTTEASYSLRQTIKV